MPNPETPTVTGSNEQADERIRTADPFITRDSADQPSRETPANPPGADGAERPERRDTTIDGTPNGRQVLIAADDVRALAVRAFEAPTMLDALVTLQHGLDALVRQARA